MHPPMRLASEDSLSTCVCMNIRALFAESQLHHDLACLSDGDRLVQYCETVHNQRKATAVSLSMLFMTC
jgi:hypothetical protein